MGAVRKRSKPVAKAEERSHGDPVAVAAVMTFLCLCLGGCGEVADEDGTPEEGFFLIVCCLLGFLLGVLLWWALPRSETRKNRWARPGHLVGGLSLLLLVAFFITMAPRWHLSIECDQSPVSPSCNSHGSMDCHRDHLGSADRPRCTCDPGWTGPFCSIGTTSTQTTTSTRTRTSSTQSTRTMSTSTRTSSTSTRTTRTTTTTLAPQCPGGSDPKLGVDAILDPSIHCPGVSLGMGSIPGAVIGATVAGAPVLVVLCISLRQRLMRKVIFDVIVASLDMGSDLFWVLTGDFYGIETLIPAVFFLVSPSLLFTMWFFGDMMQLRPRSWAERLDEVSAAFWHRAAEVLERMCRMLGQHCRKRFSPYCGCFQYRTTIDGDLDVCCANIAFWLGAVLLAAWGLVTIFCSALLVVISGILLCCCLALTWLIASCLWCATQTSVLMALHVTRLAALRPINKHVLRMLDPDSPASTATAAPPRAAAAGATTPAAPTSHDATGWIDPQMWHATLLVEAVLESLPCFVINVVDMVLLIQVGLGSISVQAVLAASTSFLVIFRILFRYFYWLVYKRVPLRDVRIEYQTKKDATGAVAGAVGSAIG